MTEPLYQEDAYLKEFEATVTAVDAESRAVVLDRTAFFPGGGGQEPDAGDLMAGDTRYTIKRAKKQGDNIFHFIDGDSLPDVGTTVIGKIDWDRRYKAMRTHTAMHILCGVIWRDYQKQVTGGDMKLLEGRMDFEFDELDRDTIEAIEQAINAEVNAGREVRVDFHSREAAFQIPDLIRTKINLLPEGIETVRTIEIVGLDLQADGGTHVNNTSEVGDITITKYKSKGGANKRLYIELH
jgi:misacylated tRNA(Ala) deacylase